MEGPEGRGKGRSGSIVVPRILTVESDSRMIRNWSRILDGQALLLPALSLEMAFEYTTVASWRRYVFPFVFVSLRLPDGDGIDLLPRLAQLLPRPQVAVITDQLNAGLAVRLHGLCSIALPKPLDRESLIGALTVLRSAACQGSVLERFAHAHRLSQQEMRLLMLGVQEINNKEAAEQLECGECTVRTYWQRIFAKVGCTNQRDVLARLFRFSRDLQAPGPASVRGMAENAIAVGE